MMWLVNIIEVADDECDGQALTGIGLMLHFTVLVQVGSIVSTMDYLFHAIPAASDAAARARFMSIGLPATLLMPVVVVIVYILVVLELWGPGLYEDVFDNGRIAFVWDPTAVYLAVIIEVVLGFLVSVYYVMFMQWGDADSPSENLQQKKTLMFAAMWTWVGLVAAAAAVLAGTEDNGEYNANSTEVAEFLLLIVLVIQGLVLFWMAFSEINGTMSTPIKMMGDTTYNPTFGTSRATGTPGAMTPALESNVVTAMSGLGGFAGTPPPNTYGAPPGAGGGGFIDLAGVDSPNEFDDMIFKLRSSASA
jgi:hypothetical protein